MTGKFISANLKALPPTESESAQPAPLTLAAGGEEFSVLAVGASAGNQGNNKLCSPEQSFSSGGNLEVVSPTENMPAQPALIAPLQVEGGELSVFAVGAGAGAGVGARYGGLGNNEHSKNAESHMNSSADAGVSTSPATPQRATCPSRRSKRRKFGAKSRMGLKVQVRDAGGMYWDATIVKDHGHCPCQSFAGLRKDFDVDYGEGWDPAVETNVSCERIKWPD